MHRLNLTETIKKRDPKLIKAKRKLVRDLTRALNKEDQINTALGNELGNYGSRAINTDGPARGGSLLGRFVKGVDESYKHRVNKKVLEDLLVEARRDLAGLEAMTDEQRNYVRKTLTIIYRNGIVKPNHFPVARRDLRKYHWQYESQFEPWKMIGERGQAEIRPNAISGKVRLHYDHANDHLKSNVIDISTVIKRQAAAAKRQPYTFGKTDPEFISRCKGVAGRILRLTEPRIKTTTTFNSEDARFSMRVFQDRVARLPKYLGKTIPQIIRLCNHRLSTRRGQADDEDYIKMIEFCEPTIHLNPAGLRRDLKEIGAGKRVVLKLADVARVVLSPDETDESSSEESGESADEETKDQYADKFDRMKPRELISAASRGKLSQYNVNGRSSYDAIRNALRAKARDDARQELIFRQQREREEEAERQAELLRQQEEEAERQAELLRQQEEEAKRQAEQETDDSDTEEVEYKEFNLPGRGYTRVRYEAPDGKTQGNGGYYYGVTDEGEQVRVRGSKNIRELRSEADILEDERRAAEAREKQLEDDRRAAEAREKQIEDERRAAEAREKQIEDERRAAEAREKQIEDERRAAEAREKQIEDERRAAEARELEARRQELERVIEQNYQEAISTLTPEEIAYIQEVFNEHDSNGDGEISFDELTAALIKVGQDESLVESMLEDHDINKDQGINYKEFMIWSVNTGALDAWRSGRPDDSSSDEESNVEIPEESKVEDVEYREFNLPGRGYTRVRYETPEGKTQGRGGYYYGVTDDGEEVRVKGSKNIREVDERELITETPGAAAPGSSSEEESPDDAEYREFNLPGRGYTRVRYETPEGKTQGRGGYYYGVTDDGEEVRVKGKNKIREVGVAETPVDSSPEMSSSDDDGSGAGAPIENFKEFNLPGRGYTRVRYEAPEGKTQGRGGYYYGVTNSGEEVRVKGKNKIREVQSSASSLMLLGSDASAEESKESSSSAASTAAAAPDRVYKEFNIPGRGWTAVRYEAPEGKTQGNGGYYYGLTRQGERVSVRGKARVRDVRRSVPADTGSLNMIDHDDVNDQFELATNDEERKMAELSASMRSSESKFIPAGELTEMLANMTDDWASSEDELNFAEESESEEMKSDDLSFAESSAVEHNDSGSLEFAESSAIETDSDNDFAVSSSAEKTSSGLDFAESSAVESDSAKEQNSSAGLSWAESSDYD